MLTISVRPSPSTNDHEVLLFASLDNLISRFDDDAMGLDPDDLLRSPCALVPGPSPRQVRIARCDCGVVGCGDVEVTVARDGEHVTWSADGATVDVRFDATSYLAELDRAMADHSWETPDRTAARLIADGVDRAWLAERDLHVTWASGRIRPDTMTIALATTGYQLLVHQPWQGEPPSVIADACCTLLRQDPRTWPDVRWNEQASGLGPPACAGPGWRRGR